MVMKLINKGFKEFGRMLDPRRFTAALKQEVMKATVENAKFLEQEVKAAIDGARIGPNNKPLTVMIKKRDHPLLDSGRMREAVEAVIVDWKTASVGIPSSSPSYKVAKWVSEGRSVPVTDRMRQMFKMLWLVSEGRLEPSRLQGRAAELWSRSTGPWYPLSDNTRIIRIPPRPFIELTTKRPDVKAKIRKTYATALANTWRVHVRSARGK